MRSIARILCPFPLLFLCLAPPIHGEEAPTADDPVVAPVVTAPASERDLEATITGFGKVETDANSLLAINVAHNGLVSRVYVHAGEAVAAGAPLLDLVPTPAARLTYQQVKTALDLARADLARTQRLFSEQLATRDQVDKTQSALKDAEAALQAQTQAGAGSVVEHTTAPFAGTVTTLAATEGEQLQEGAKALTLARSDALVVRLGVEPEDAPRLRPGMNVSLVDTFTQATFPGRLAAIDAIINPQTRLVDVSTRLGASGDGDAPMIGAIMRGQIVLAREHVLAVPRDAVLSDADGAYVFVVRDGKAHRVPVKMGIESSKDVAISGEVKPGEPVVIQGNYELKDGMAVRSVAGGAL